MVSDRNKMRQIVINLLMNAIDSIEESGTIQIRVRERGKEISLEVIDTGTGIREEMVSEIFKPFFTTKAKGTGLGLAIAERFAKALGGKISVENNFGRGSTFSVIVPQE